jgi:murein L,D-transpeptidase YcbB/YkuD
LKYATPVFSANMQSIVFNPEWTVPPTIVQENLWHELAWRRLVWRQLDP